MPAATKPQPSAGATVALSAGLPADPSDVADYEGLTFTNVAEIQSVGEFLRNYVLIPYNSLSDRQTKNKKGSYTEGAPAVAILYAPGNAGQALALTALKSDDDYSFRITLNDGTTFYSSGLLTGFPISLPGVDEMVAGTMNMTFNSEVLVDYPA